MKKDNYTYSITSSKTPAEIFNVLLDIKQWWNGLYNEVIKGNSKKLNDEFTFEAGDGIHYTKQKLVELVPDQRIVWLITESRLNFLKDPGEWKDTRLRFDLSKQGDQTKLTFTHEGLMEEIECYDQCSSAWNGYLTNLEKKLA